VAWNLPYVKWVEVVKDPRVDCIHGQNGVVRAIMFRTQKTINQKLIFTGKGLHTGRIVRMEILPAEANTGIVFLRVDNPNAKPLIAHVNNVTSTELCTTIGSGISSIGTIEHLMAAFAGLGIDNAIVKVNAPEIPIMDGSALEFVEAMMLAGLKDLAVGRKLFVVKETFKYSEGDRTITIEPSRSIRYRCSIDFGDSYIGSQSIDFSFTLKEFLKLANARTFCHLNEVNALRTAGLALGGSLENAIVVTDHGVMNEEGLRADDEFVRHKLLDCLGDLALVGAPMIGKVTVHKPGHSFHSNAMNELLMRKDRYLAVIEPGSFRKTSELEEIALFGALASYG